MSRLEEITKENFDKWFGESKAVNEKGEALTLYHGSRIPWIVSFTKESIGSGVVGPGSGDAQGFWFSTNKDTAEYYTDRAPKKSADINESYSFGEEPAYYYLVGDRTGQCLFTHGPFKSIEEADEGMELQINAYNRKLRQDTYITAVHLKLENPLVIDVIPRKEEFESARAGGYDGIIARSVVDGHGISDVYCVFSPSQIKAADNTGAFSSLDNDIRDMKWLPQREMLVKADKAANEMKRLLKIGSDPKKR